MNSHISASAKRSGKKKVAKMVLKKVANGFTSETHMEPDADDKAGYLGGHEPSTSVHPSVSHMLKHVKNTMGGDMGSATQPTSSVGPMDGNVDSGAGY